MKGWHLFRHALAMITRNVGAAFRVTGLPYAAMLAIVLILPAIFRNEGLPIPWTTAVGMLIAGYFAAFVWMAVQWHRYVLLGEIQSGVVPHYHGRASRAYLWRSILLGVAGVALFFGLSFLAGLVAAATQSTPVAIAANVAAFAGSLAILGRVSPILPAAALDERLSFGAAWRATAGGTGAILVAGILLALLSSIPAILVALGLGLVAQISNLAFQWLVTLVGLCLMTTFYGHYVEGRELHAR